MFNKGNNKNEVTEMRLINVKEKKKEKDVFTKEKHDAFGPKVTELQSIFLGRKEPAEEQSFQVQEQVEEKDTTSTGIKSTILSGEPVEVVAQPRKPSKLEVCTSDCVPFEIDASTISQADKDGYTSPTRKLELATSPHNGIPLGGLVSTHTHATNTIFKRTKSIDRLIGEVSRLLPGTPRTAQQTHQRNESTDSTADFLREAEALVGQLTFGSSS